MLIHEQIRSEAIERLKPLLSNHIKRFYNGRLLGLNPSEQCPAIAVYLEDIDAEEITVCDSEFDAMLNVAIYLKPRSGEDELDEIAELVRNAICTAEFNSLITVSLKHYRYEYDEDQAAWIASVVRFAIHYEE